MAWSLAQHTFTAGSTSVTSYSKTFGSTTTSGSLLLLYLDVNASVTWGTPSDTAGNTWTQLFAYNPVVGVTHSVAIWGCINKAATASDAVSVSWDVSTNGDIFIAEFTGVTGTILSLDGSAAISSGTGPTVSGPTYTPSVSGDLIISLESTANDPSGYGTGWSHIDMDTSLTGGAWQYYDNTGVTTARTGAWTLVNTGSQAWESVVFGITTPNYTPVLSTTPGGPGSIYPGQAAPSITPLVSTGTLYTQPLTATLTSAGSLGHKILKLLVATLVLATLMVKSITKAYSASLGLAGALTKGTRRALTAILTPVAAFTKRTGRVLIASLALTPVIAKAIRRSLVATLQSAGTLGKQIAKLLAGLLTATTSFAYSRVHTLALTATLSLNATLSRITLKNLTAAIVSLGSMQIATLKGLVASLASSGAATGGPANLDQVLGTNTLSGASYTAMTLTTIQTASANTLIVVALGCYPGSASLSFIVSDNGPGLSWTQTPVSANQGNNNATYIFHAYAPSGMAAGTTITVNWTVTGVGHPSIGAVSFTGIDPTSLVDATTNHQSTNSTAWTAGTMTTQYSDLIVATAWASNVVTTESPHYPYTQAYLIPDTGALTTMVFDYALNVPPGSNSPGGTWGTSARYQPNSAVAYRVLSGGVVKSTTRALLAQLSFDRYTTAILADNPASEYRLDDTTTTAVDLLGKVSGTYSGTYTQGQPGALVDDSDTAASFSAGRITLASNPLAVGSISVEVWFKTSGATGTILDMRPAVGANVALVVRFVSNVLSFYVGNGTTNPSVTVTGTWNNGQWHHFVGTYDGSTIRTYIDGVQTGTPVSLTGPISYGSSPIPIIASDGTPRNFAGSLDEFAFYNYALSPTQVQAHYLTGTTQASRLIKSVGKSLIATLTSVATVVSSHAYLQVLNATLATAGAISLFTTKLINANLGLVGSIAKRIPITLVAALTMAGAINKHVAHSLTAVLNLAGNVAHGTVHMTVLAANLAFTGAISTIHAVGVVLTATLSATGSLAKSIRHGLTAILTSSGALAKMTGRKIAASLTSSGTLAKRVSHLLTATLGLAGSIFSGSIRLVVLAANLALSSAFVKSIRRMLSATLISATTMVRSIRHQLQAALSPVGTMAKRITRSLVAALGWAGNLTSGIIHIMALTANLIMSGQVTRKTLRSLTAALSATTTFIRQVGKRMTAQLSSTSTTRRVITKGLSALLGMAGVVINTSHQLYFKALNATLGTTGTLTRGFTKVLTATLGWVTGIIQGWITKPRPTPPTPTTTQYRGMRGRAFVSPSVSAPVKIVQRVWRGLGSRSAPQAPEIEEEEETPPQTQHRGFGPR